MVMMTFKNQPEIMEIMEAGATIKKKAHISILGTFVGDVFAFFIGALGQNQMETSTKPGKLTGELFCM